jgi:hypothetical protein
MTLREPSLRLKIFCDARCNHYQQGALLMTPFCKNIIAVFCAALLVSSNTVKSADSAGTTRIAKWKDDKKAAFMLFFDDSMPSHVKNVVPELKGRKMIATFYVNPGKGEWQVNKEKWEKELPAEGMIYGNHTFTHKGVKDMADAEEEFGKCNDAIMAVHPEYKKPCLISFGTPGVKQGAWNITPDELKVLYAKHHLVLRTNVNGRFAFIHLKTAEEMLKVVDKTIETGGSDCVAFHGVGGEWLSISMPIFMQFINGLADKREALWITDHISLHKYDTERSSAEVQTLEATDKQIRLKLSCKADPQLYDAPLTLVTRVPATWKKVQISQGSSKSSAIAEQELVKFDAMPNGEVIAIQPAD